MKMTLIMPALVAGLVLSIGLNTPAAAQAQRNYDCSKPGNANKTVCKTAAAKTAVQPAARPMPSNPKVATASAPKARNYDCSKAGNRSKAACKVPAATVRPAPVRAAAPATKGSSPQGATAKCRDNTYSQSRDHRGACSHHGGVASWY